MKNFLKILLLIGGYFLITYITYPLVLSNPISWGMYIGYSFCVFPAVFAGGMFIFSLIVCCILFIIGLFCNEKKGI